METIIGSCKFCSPSGTFFSPGHTWVRKNEYGLIKIGIDEIMVRTLEEISVVNIVRTETFVHADDFLFEIKSGNKLIPIKAPITGVLKFINPFIVGRKIEYPYGDDWVALMLATGFIEDKRMLLTGAEYKTWIEYELKKLGSSFREEFPRGNFYNEAYSIKMKTAPAS